MKILLNSKRFAKCHYYREGNGPAVLLVHGFGEDAGIFRYQTESLKQHYKVIVPDLPGSGESELPEEEMSMELLAEYIDEIILQEGLDTVILLGHSMGGYASLVFAEKFADKLNGFGLIHSSAYEDTPEKKENRRKSIRLIKNEGKEVFLKAMIPNLYSKSSLTKIEDEIQFHLTMALNTSSDSLTAYYQAMINRYDTTSVLKQSKIPVLFVIGREDNAIPYADMLQQSTMPEISSVELLENTGHTSMLECPEKLNDILNNFCKYVLQHKIA